MATMLIFDENLKKSFCQKPLFGFQNNFTKMFLEGPYLNIVQKILICQKNMASRGRSVFHPPKKLQLKGNGLLEMFYQNPVSTVHTSSSYMVGRTPVSVY